MNNILKLFDLSSLDDNLKIKVKKQFIYVYFALAAGFFGSIVTKKIIIFFLFTFLALFLTGLNLYVITLCKKDKLKLLEAKCIEYVKRNLKEHIYRSYYLFTKDNLYYKLYTSKLKYAPGNKALFYLTEENVIYENEDTLIILSTFLEIKEKTGKKK